MSVRRLSILQSYDSTGKKHFLGGVRDLKILFQEFLNFLSLELKTSKNKSRHMDLL